MYRYLYTGLEMIKNKRHTGLVVRNLSASIDFYEKLGLKVWKRQIESGEFISEVVGLDNAEIETAKLKVADGSLIELLEYKSHPTKPLLRNYSSNSHGCSHVAFTVENVEVTAKEIEVFGGSIINPPIISDDGKVKVMYCHDIDGILIEMVEEL